MTKPGGRKRLVKRQLAGVVGRLREWFTNHEPCLKTDGSLNISGIATRTGIPRTTIDGWFRADPANASRTHAPELFHIYLLSEAEGISPTWLLLGVGPERIAAARADADVATELRERVVTQVVAKYPRIAPALIAATIPEPRELLRGAISWALTDIERRKDAVMAYQLHVELNHNPYELTPQQLRWRFDAAKAAAEHVTKVSPEVLARAKETWAVQSERDIAAATVEQTEREAPT